MIVHFLTVFLTIKTSSPNILKTFLQIPLKLYVHRGSYWGKKLPWTILDTCMPKFGLLFCFVFSLKIYFNLPILLPFFLCLSFLYVVMLNFQMKYSPFLRKIASTINLLWMLFFQERRIFHLEWAKGKQQNWQWSFPQNVGRFLHVTLAGLVRFEMMYLCKELSLLNSLFTNVND